MNMNRVILGLVVAVSCGGTAVAQIDNTAYGTNALAHNSTGSYNSAFGVAALYETASGISNTAIGFEALESNDAGSDNTASGVFALFLTTSGSYNAASGSYGLYHNTIGFGNSASGSAALYFNTTGSYNSAIGYDALRSNTTGSNNSASGYGALYSNTTGSNNIGVGQYAGYNPTAGSNNIEVGNKGVAADDAVIRIGTQGTQHATYLAGVHGVNVTGGEPVMVTAKGQLGVVSSSRRYKEDIRSMGDSSDRLLKLHPVVFRYKLPDENGQKPDQYGLIAEEVAIVMPELVIYNEQKQPETVAYQSLAPLLLNELQKADRKIERMQTEIDELRKAQAGR